jgi:hypothetical protein
LYVLGQRIAAQGDEMDASQLLAASGTLVNAFADAGVLELPCLTRAKDISLHEGALYILGDDTGTAILARHEALTGALVWARTSVMDAAGAVTAAASGVYIGGSRGAAWEIERWALDGTPIWAQTYNRDKSPSGVRALAVGSTYWLYATGDYQYGANHDQYYESRAIADGLLHLAGPTAPPE